ncbi:MAG: hypothetical protein U1C74_08465, partial [Phenylobacterium sp.]|nr:hypothetical protein [Phenylobacterium sp.]
ALDRADTAYGSGNDARRSLFLPAGLAASADVDAVARLLEAFGRPVTVSVHPEVDGRADRFVLITAPESSAIWRLCDP